ncbi:hypothetical protein PoB_001068000 [Plakobranchus ocellatus]|uniref:Uncharacterized protein n=1 Tax=Plakobranchus ocellatus TaxID=259542 RepID=A0AAV3YNY3_9GAST|nr:hypothetical protein PoB_001068000 [Plakobranchus ocellatus]
MAAGAPSCGVCRRGNLSLSDPEPLSCQLAQVIEAQSRHSPSSFTFTSPNQCDQASSSGLDLLPASNDVWSRDLLLSARAVPEYLDHPMSGIYLCGSKLS